MSQSVTVLHPVDHKLLFILVPLKVAGWVGLSIQQVILWAFWKQYGTRFKSCRPRPSVHFEQSALPLTSTAGAAEPIKAGMVNFVPLVKVAWKSVVFPCNFWWPDVTKLISQNEWFCRNAYFYPKFTKNWTDLQLYFKKIPGVIPQTAITGNGRGFEGTRSLPRPICSAHVHCHTFSGLPRPLSRGLRLLFAHDVRQQKAKH